MFTYKNNVFLNKIGRCGARTHDVRVISTKLYRLSWPTDSITKVVFLFVVWARFVFVDATFCKENLKNTKIQAPRLSILSFWTRNLMQSISSIPYGLVVRIRRFHRRGPGSIPGVGRSSVFVHVFYFLQKLKTTRFTIRNGFLEKNTWSVWGSNPRRSRY